jgi:hypothetical protein
MTPAAFADTEKKIARLNKRLASKGFPLVAYKAETEMRSLADVFNRPSGFDVQVEVVNFEFTSDFQTAIIESGYEVIGVIDHIENMVHCFAEGVSLESFRHRKVCDHCGTKRNRAKTIIVRKGEQLLQVGTTCLSDFVGVDVNALVKGIEFHSEQLPAGDMEDYFHSNMPYRMTFPLAVVTPYILAAIHEYGFMPTSEEKSTRNLVTMCIKGKFHLAPTEEQEALVPSIIEWMMALKPSSDFNLNVAQIAENGICSLQTLGLLCAAVHIFLKNKAEVEAKAAQKGDELESNHVGSVGDKLNMRMIHLYTATFETMYGLKSIYTFEDESGNCFVWSSSVGWKFEPAEKILVKATIKAHSEYRGKKQTEITRAKITRGWK